MRGEVNFGAECNKDETEWRPIIGFIMRVGPLRKEITFRANCYFEDFEGARDMGELIFEILTTPGNMKDVRRCPKGELKIPRTFNKDEIN